MGDTYEKGYVSYYNAGYAILIQSCSSVPEEPDSKVSVVSSESSYLSNCKLLGNITAETKASSFFAF